MHYSRFLTYSYYLIEIVASFVYHVVQIRDVLVSVVFPSHTPSAATWRWLLCFCVLLISSVCVCVCVLAASQVTLPVHLLQGLVMCKGLHCTQWLVKSLTCY